MGKTERRRKWETFRVQSLLSKRTLALPIARRLPARGGTGGLHGSCRQGTLSSAVKGLHLLHLSLFYFLC